MDENLKYEARRLADRVKALGLTQEIIANAVGASQSQVSRVLSGTGIRRSRLFEEICIYVESAGVGVSPERVCQNNELVSAIASVWDGTAHQARVLADIIRSLGGLTLRSSGHASIKTGIR